MAQSKVWEVMADLAQTAFGTPMFSRRPDAGYKLVFLEHPLFGVLARISTRDNMSLLPISMCRVSSCQTLYKLHSACE